MGIKTYKINQVGRELVLDKLEQLHNLLYSSTNPELIEASFSVDEIIESFTENLEEILK